MGRALAKERCRRGRWRGTVLCVAAVAGCQERTLEPLAVPNRTLGPMVLAVAPAMNVSGSVDFDPNRLADLMASELHYASNIGVIPVNRVLAVLKDQGRTQVESPGHALEVARILGADGILVFAVTEYDPYEPPVVGITAQLYGRRRDFTVSSATGNVDDAGGEPTAAAQASAPLAETAHVFNAAHEWVRQELQQYAAARDADASPFGWRRYVASQQHYLRFCCYATIRSLIGGPGADVFARR